MDKKDALGRKIERDGAKAPKAKDIIEKKDFTFLKDTVRFREPCRFISQIVGHKL